MKLSELETGSPPQVHLASPTLQLGLESRLMIPNQGEVHGGVSFVREHCLEEAQNWTHPTHHPLVEILQ